METTSMPAAAASTTTSLGDSEAPLWQAIITLIMLVGMLVAMALEVAPADMIMMTTLTLFIPLGIVSVGDAVAGFANTGMLTVAVLLVVAAGVQATGATNPIRTFLERATRLKSGRTMSLPRILLIVIAPISLLSAFLNNTPVVAMMIPVLERFGQRLHIAPTKLLIPLSYASILGGTCTLIGTSTNLVVIGLAQEADPDFSMGLFDIAQVGLPVLLAGTLFMILAGPRLLPDRQGVAASLQRPKEYMTSMYVRNADEGGGSLVGKSIADAGLRQLPDLFLVQVERANSGDVINAPAPETILQAGDKLLFAGVVDSVVALGQVPGLRLAEQGSSSSLELYKLKGDDILIEAVVAPRSILVHRTVRQIGFRSRYHAAIIAVHRHGERIREKIGNITLQAGDALLMVAKADFLKQYRNQEHFALVSQVRQAINLEVLIVIAAAFGISKAMDNSGAADMLARGLLAAAKPTGTAGFYIMIYLATTLFSSAVTNNAAITIMFPVAFQAAVDANVRVDRFRHLQNSP
ncbi:uncharacterized protein MONBRDRAFT_8761 [Monosiga brevicollis MX1]|uniref:RCK C-terminal domain-containing protein n=1 Tax=Monosiga brevicollis TaxID=81824 RepID=A9V123_MONBE|nr:uncharacterized protein MONBRDRAFT_8761 [Monosiga brevicollis MX1]EDQ88856.1 predicted protein [Monosiga brevicollis MX1]|eukprot:XP_001746469.1 hypothetical protein [Monosiga brevicollis MX1]